MHELRGVNSGSVNNQPPIPVESQHGLSLVRDPRLGNRRCSCDLGHGCRGGSRGSRFLGHPIGDQVEGASLVRRLYYIARWQGGRLVGHRAIRGYPEVRSGGRRWGDVAES
ncbi:hypothetical protein B296_00044642 [Ensete ventricosum]|uniref:Uncharacterized protein n=1 Tax=Ensete ventricosum TaxID=4639 RepID=A0A426YN93_ENSVE|nr:hypothetical protein B296_00044642 [Ensete ventricosum]